MPGFFVGFIAVIGFVAIFSISTHLLGKLYGVENEDDWNQYQILAVDDHILQILNGVVTAELDDPAGARSGLIGLQIHSGPPQEVAFRNLFIKEF